jgi:hypothetical protein
MPAVAEAAGAVAAMRSRCGRGGSGRKVSSVTARQHGRAEGDRARARDRRPVSLAVSAQGKSAVTCTRPAFGATSATFRAYPSLGALYGAYIAAIRAVAPGSYHSNFGGCTKQQTDDEVSWNHSYEHPRRYSLSQSRSGRLTDDQAAGRVLCTFSNSIRIIWTQNDGRLLGVLNGAPHENSWDWWKGVHHSIDLPGSNSNMSMSSWAGVSWGSAGPSA